MSGHGAYILRAIGAFIRWMLSGFRDSYKQLFDGPIEDTGKAFNNDLINIFIGAGGLLLFFAIISFLFL